MLKSLFWVKSVLCKELGEVVGAVKQVQKKSCLKFILVMNLSLIINVYKEFDIVFSHLEIFS